MAKIRCWKCGAASVVEMEKKAKYGVLLHRDIPIGKEHGASAGRVFPLKRLGSSGRDQEAFFDGDAGVECAAFTGFECDVIQLTESGSTVCETHVGAKWEELARKVPCVPCLIKEGAHLEAAKQGYMPIIHS